MIGLKYAFRISLSSVFHNPSYGCSILANRYLYSSAALGIDQYVKTRERIKNQFTNVEEKFKTKIINFINADSNSMIFTEDLKHMLHLVEGNNDDLSLIRQMMTKFSKQNKDLRFGSFIFGPVVLRMYHFLNKPKEALENFTNPDLDGFFDQLVSFQILMDLLFKNHMYEEVIEVFEIVQRKQVQGAKYPKNAVVLVLAACYKLNTTESFNFAKHLWSELTKAGHYPMRRAGTFAAALAVKQNAPHVALEILGSLKQATYVTVRNLKVEALADLDRPEDALPIFRNALLIDSGINKKHTFTEDAISKMKSSLERMGNKDMTQEFEKLEARLRELNCINSEPLDTQLCSEIDSVNFSKTVKRPVFDRNFRQLKPGLEDMF